MKMLRLLIYKLELPKRIKILYIWHISVLESVDPDTPLIINISDIDPES